MHGWLALVEGELELLVAREVSVVRVVQVLCHAEDQRVVELVQLVVRELHVVLDAVAVQVGDATLPGFAGL